MLESVASASVHRALVLLNLLAGMLSVQLPFAILGIGAPFGGGEALWAAMCLATDDECEQECWGWPPRSTRTVLSSSVSL